MIYIYVSSYVYIPKLKDYRPENMYIYVHTYILGKSEVPNTTSYNMDYGMYMAHVKGNKSIKTHNCNWIQYTIDKKWYIHMCIAI